MFEEDATNLGTLYTINEGEEEVQRGDKGGLYTLDEGEEKVLLKSKDLTCVPCSKSDCCKPTNGQTCKFGAFTGLLFCKKHYLKAEGYNMDEGQPDECDEWTVTPYDFSLDPAKLQPISKVKCALQGCDKSTHGRKCSRTGAPQIACWDEHYKLHKRNGQRAEQAAMETETAPEPVRAREIDHLEMQDLQQRTLFVQNHNDLVEQQKQKQRQIGQAEFRHKQKQV